MVAHVLNELGGPLDKVALARLELAVDQLGVTKAICALADDEGNTLVMYNPCLLYTSRCV